MRTSWAVAVIAVLPVALGPQHSEASDPVIIQSPIEGAIVPQTFEVSVTFGEITSCDTSTECFHTPASGLILNVDDGAFDGCLGCCCATSFTITLVPGPHKLQAAAVGEEIIYSEYVNILVQDEGGQSSSIGGQDTSVSSTQDAGGSSSAAPGGPTEGEGESVTSGSQASSTSTTSTTATSATSTTGTSAKGCECSLGTSARLQDWTWLLLVLSLVRRASPVRRDRAGSGAPAARRVSARRDPRV